MSSMIEAASETMAENVMIIVFLLSMHQMLRVDSKPKNTALRDSIEKAMKDNRLRKINQIQEMKRIDTKQIRILM